MTHHLLIAHGSPDPRHRAVMRTLATQVTERGLTCSVAFLDHDDPTVHSALAGLSGDVVTLGMLLAPGYHASVDVPRLLASAPPEVTVHDLGPLGAGKRLFPVVDWLVADVGVGPDTPVILATAGSTREAARLALAQFASDWQRTRTGDVLVAAGTGPGLSLEDAARRYSVDGLPAGVRGPRAVVLPLKISPGVLADRTLNVAEKHGLLAAGTLAESPLFVDVLVDRLDGR
jgi:sirohydrochlorin ferrochelatase